MAGTLRVVHAYVRTRALAHRLTTRERIARHQEQKLREFLPWVRRHSPFYREQLRTDALEDWRRAPVIDKSIMMREFSRLNTRGIDRDRAFEVAHRAESDRNFRPTLDGLTVGLSSGTSGNRGLFLASPEEGYLWAGTMLAKVLPEPLYRHQRFALFLRANSNLYESMGSRRLRFGFFDLMRPIDELARSLEAFAPTVLAAPPSMLRILADAKRRGSLRVAPDKVVSVAEALDPMDELFIREGFRRKVHQIYQSTEGFLATTCDEGTLHVNEDAVVLQPEWIDEAAGRFVPIVTDFVRRTQPIIRYRLNDVLTMKREPCRCGSAYMALERVEGRCDDLLYLPRRSGGALSPVFADFVSRAIIGASPEVEEYLVRQRDPRSLEVALHVPGGDERAARDEVFAALQNLCDRLGVETPVIEFRRERHQVGAVKMRRITRAFDVGVDAAAGVLR